MDALVGNAPLPTKAEEKTVKKFNEKDRAIASIKHDDKWALITDHFKERIEFYRKDLAGADLSNKDLASVGEKYMVCNLVAQELEGIISYVEQTTRAVSEN